jgi:hypothetical protein
MRDQIHFSLTLDLISDIIDSIFIYIYFCFVHHIPPRNFNGGLFRNGHGCIFFIPPQSMLMHIHNLHGQIQHTEVDLKLLWRMVSQLFLLY